MRPFVIGLLFGAGAMIGMALMSEGLVLSLDRLK